MSTAAADDLDMPSRLADPWFWVPIAIVMLLIAAAIAWDASNG